MASTRPQRVTQHNGSTAITAACGILQNYTNVALAIDANATFIRGSLANYNLTLPAAVGTLSTWVLFVQVRVSLLRQP